jgi:hypothetical protein
MTRIAKVLLIATFSLSLGAAYADDDLNSLGQANPAFTLAERSTLENGSGLYYLVNEYSNQGLIANDYYEGPNKISFQEFFKKIGYENLIDPLSAYQEKIHSAKTNTTVVLGLGIAVSTVGATMSFISENLNPVTVSSSQITNFLVIGLSLLGGGGLIDLLSIPAANAAKAAPPESEADVTTATTKANDYNRRLLAANTQPAVKPAQL